MSYSFIEKLVYMSSLVHVEQHMQIDECLGKTTVIRRRPSPRQGMALEILGHAIEYLMDSYVLMDSSDGGPCDAEAAHILMDLNRRIFLECPEVVPFYRRMQSRFFGIMGRAQGMGRTS